MTRIHLSELRRGDRITSWDVDVRVRSVAHRDAMTTVSNGTSSWLFPSGMRVEVADPRPVPSPSAPHAYGGMCLTCGTPITVVLDPHDGTEYLTDPGGCDDPRPALRERIDWTGATGRGRPAGTPGGWTA